MNGKILVAYASRCGSTAEVAAGIGETLRRCGQSVDVLPVGLVKSLDAYGGVLVGSAVRRNRWLPEATAFVRDHRMILRRIPTGLFTVCLQMADPNELNRRASVRFLNPVYDFVHADVEGFFGGCLDYGRLSFGERAVMKIHGGTPAGDYRNWRLIRQWSENASRILTAS